MPIRRGMRKLPLLLAVLVSMSFTNQGPMGQDDDTTPRITLTPKPPTQGGKVTITYSGTPGTVLVLDWDPAAEPTSATVGKDGNVSVTVPANATSLIVSDPNGGANWVSTVVTAR